NLLGEGLEGPRGRGPDAKGDENGRDHHRSRRRCAYRMRRDLGATLAQAETTRSANSVSGSLSINTNVAPRSPQVPGTGPIAPGWEAASANCNSRENFNIALRSWRLAVAKIFPATRNEGMSKCGASEVSGSFRAYFRNSGALPEAPFL